MTKTLGTVSKGECFGELALMYLTPRAATVVAKEKSVVWIIDRTTFKNILMKVSETKIKEYVNYLDTVQILEPLIEEEKVAMAKAMVEMHFQQDEVILQEGETGNTFYILYDGEVAVVKGEDQLTTKVANKERQQAQIFGERALINNDVRAATIKVVSATAKALAMDRETFHLLLGPLEDIIKAGDAAQDKKGNRHTRASLVRTGAPSVNPSDARREHISRSDLVKLGLLGCGGFGSVELYEHKKTGNTYAMKALSKGFIKKLGMQESVMNEKNILMMTNSAFIIKLYECYNGAQSLYFLLEPALGGELYATYKKKGFHGSVAHCKYYVGGTLFAFEHLHERHVIYRDLKPENLLLDEKGEIKLTDMGLAKFVIGKTFSTCGTPDYFAPELIASTGHTNAVDWWTLGILTFELMTGAPPFESANPMAIYAKVNKGIEKVHFPQSVSGPVGDLILGLLQHEPSQRLPMRPGGPDRIRDHPWYKDFEWAAMRNMTFEVPYKPVVKSQKDIANFSVNKANMPKQLEYVDDGSGWDKDFATFVSPAT
jgi:CRP-like cAMP-binding protein